MSELASVVGAIRERTELPAIVDADTGFGNALNVQRTVRLLERAGASAIQIEDQSLPKRCGHLDGKALVSASEMNGKIKAALDVRLSSNTLVIARTDAVGVEGYDQATDRAEGYLEAGADVLFIEALQNEHQIDDIVKRFGGRIPLLINMVEGGKTPLKTANQLQDIGFSIVIFPGGLVRVFAHTAGLYFGSLMKHGSSQPFKNKMLDLAALNDLLGTDQMLEQGQTYSDGGD